MQIGNSIRLSKKYGVNPTIPSCFWCGQLKNEIALLGKYGGRGQDLEAPMGIFLDYGACDDCLEKRKLGVTLMEALTEPIFEGQPEMQIGVYPTGKWCVIKKDAADRMFGGHLTDKNVLFVDQEIFDHVVGGAAETD